MGGASFSSLLTAPIAFHTPEILAGSPVPQATHFALYDSQAMAEAAVDGPQMTYLTYFTGPVQGLTAGTPVQMNGVQVGRVREVRLHYVPETATLQTPVTLEIDPRKLEIEVTPSMTREELRGRMNDAMQKLVQKGMRATLSSSLILPGASAVSLDMTGRSGRAQLDLTHEPPVIPAASGTSGVEGALAAINDVAGTIRRLPLQDIAAHMRSAAQQVDTLVSDPSLHQSLQHLNTSLSELEKVAVTTRENIGPIVQSLRDAAGSADAAAKRAGQLLGNSDIQNFDLSQLIKELTRTAEAVRALASYLTENPDALLKGRSK